MLRQLKIKNFAIIEEQSIDFKQGLNIIMGETGAGKSIIIDSLLLLAGARSNTDQVRKGEIKAVIEAIFILEEGHPIHQLLKELELDSFGGELIIRREISAKGGNRSFINDTPVQVNDLKKVGSLIIDFHGQHQHQSLLNRDNHINIIDRLIRNINIIDTYQNAYKDLSVACKALTKNLSLEKELNEKQSFRKFQFDEISKVDPQIDEDQTIENELKKLENAEWIVGSSKKLYADLYAGAGSVLETLTDAAKITKELEKYETTFNDYTQEINSAIISLTEVAKFANNYAGDIEFSPEKIESLRQRSKEIKNLCKKYGSIERVLELKAELEEQLNLTENFEEQIKQLEKEIEKKSVIAGEAAGKLSSERQNTAKAFEASIENSLKNLGIDNPAFRVDFSRNKSDDMLTGKIDGTKYKLNHSGVDQIEFLISTNKGEELKALADVASGGEISRVMLAIKSIIADISDVSVLVFDEIDSGISGRIAQKAGLVMKSLSKNRQILAITHLPQIAALGDNNIFVQKYEKNGRTVSVASILSEEEVTNEVAKLLGGEKINENHLSTAKELMKIA